jgi:hypothetical protein
MIFRAYYQGFRLVGRSSLMIYLTRCIQISIRCGQTPCAIADFALSPEPTLRWATESQSPCVTEVAFLRIIFNALADHGRERLSWVERGRVSCPKRKFRRWADSPCAAPGLVSKTRLSQLDRETRRADPWRMSRLHLPRSQEAIIQLPPNLQFWIRHVAARC